MYRHNLKSIALPVPEIIEGTYNYSEKVAMMVVVTVTDSDAAAAAAAAAVGRPDGLRKC